MINLSPSSHVQIIEIDSDQDAVAFSMLPKFIQDFLRYEMPHPTCSVEMLNHCNQMGPRKLLQNLVNWRYNDSRRIYGSSFPPVGVFKTHDNVLRSRR